MKLAIFILPFALLIGLGIYKLISSWINVLKWEKEIKGNDSTCNCTSDRRWDLVD